MKETIAKTLISLMKTTPFQEITIQKICDTIPISRNAFYYHFSNKEHLLEWTCVWNFQRYCFPYHFDDKGVGTDSMFLYIYKMKDFYTNIYRIDNGVTLHHCLMKAHISGTDIEHVKEYTTLQEGPWKKISKEVYTRYATAGIAAVLTYWVAENYKIPIEEISYDLRVMLTEPLPVIRDRYVY